jgi:hypothetical protein
LLAEARPLAAGFWSGPADDAPCGHRPRKP